MGVCPDVGEIQIQSDQDTSFGPCGAGDDGIVGSRKVLIRHGVGAETCATQHGRTFRGEVLVDFEIQAIRSSGSAAVPSRANSAA